MTTQLEAEAQAEELQAEESFRSSVNKADIILCTCPKVLIRGELLLPSQIWGGMSNRLTVKQISSTTSMP